MSFPSGSVLQTPASPSLGTPPGPVTILVTGMGGIVGQGIVKALSHTPHRIVGLDASEMAAGLYAVPQAYLIPLTRDPRFVDRVLEICRIEKARYLFLGLDMDLPVVSKAAIRFRQAGVTPIVSSPSVIDLADDKLETVRFLQSQGLPAPRTSDLADGYYRDFGFPLVLKPRRGGSRSAGLHIVPNEEELRYWLTRIDLTNYVAQEFIDGEEFTCGTITFDGTCHGVMAMRRTLRDGDTHKATIVRHAAIESHVKKVAELLKPFGPCNFQLRMRDGIPYIFEINPRVSGGSNIRALAGFNEPLMTLDYLERGQRPTFEHRPVTVMRYWKEIVVETSEIENMRRAGQISRAISSL